MSDFYIENSIQIWSFFTLVVTLIATGFNSNRIARNQDEKNKADIAIAKEEAAILRQKERDAHSIELKRIQAEIETALWGRVQSELDTLHAQVEDRDTRITGLEKMVDSLKVIISRLKATVVELTNTVQMRNKEIVKLETENKMNGNGKATL